MTEQKKVESLKELNGELIERTAKLKKCCEEFIAVPSEFRFGNLHYAIKKLDIVYSKINALKPEWDQKESKNV